MVAELGIASLHGLSQLLTDDDFRTKVEAAYRSSMPLGPSAEETFLAGLRALKLGPQRRQATGIRADGEALDSKRGRGNRACGSHQEAAPPHSPPNM
jgi:hypothetical protein